MALTIENNQRLLSIRTPGAKFIHFRFTLGTKTPNDLLMALNNNINYETSFSNGYDLSFDDAPYCNLVNMINNHQKKQLMNTCKNIRIIDKSQYLPQRSEYVCDKECCNFSKGGSTVKLSECCVKDLYGKTLMIDGIMKGNKVTDLKAKIQEMSGTPPDQQRLIFAGQQLEDNYSLEHYKMQDGSNIHLVLRLRGGMFYETSGKDGAHGPLAQNTFYDLDKDEIIELDEQ